MNFCSSRKPAGNLQRCFTLVLAHSEFLRVYFFMRIQLILGICSQPCNIPVAHKPITFLRRLLTNVKDKDKSEDRQGAVYKIKCCDCQASYIGETGRNLSTRLTEHKRATRNGDVNNHIAEHHLKTKHV